MLWTCGYGIQTGSLEHRRRVRPAQLLPRLAPGAVRGQDLELRGREHSSCSSIAPAGLIKQPPSTRPTDFANAIPASPPEGSAGVDRRRGRGEGVLVVERAPTSANAGSRRSRPPARVRARKRRAARWTRVAFLLFVFLVLYGPLLLLAVFSFNDSDDHLAAVVRVHDEVVPPGAGATRTCSARCSTRSWSPASSRPICLVIGTLMAFALTRFRFRSRGAIGGLVGAPLDPAVARDRDRGAAVLRPAPEGLPLLPPVAAHRRRDPDHLHVPAGHRDRLGAAVAVRAVAGGGGDRPGRLAGAGLAPRHHAAHHAGARRRRDLRVHVVVQQLRDQLLHDRLPADLPGVGLRHAAGLQNLPIINAISTLISGVQVVLIVIALADPAARGGGAEAILGVAGGRGRRARAEGWTVQMVAAPSRRRSPVGASRGRSGRRRDGGHALALPARARPRCSLVFFLLPMVLMVRMSLSGTRRTRERLHVRRTTPPC